MNIKVGIITQARIGSTRLPAKILKEIDGISLLEIHLTRLKEAGLSVYIATTNELGTDKIFQIGKKLGIDVKIGSVDDVLTRFYITAKENKLDIIIRVTSDCPLVCPDLIKQALAEYLSLPNWENIYYSNTLNRTFPRGMDFEIFSFSQLEFLHLNCLDLRYREHVTPFLYLEEFKSTNQLKFFEDSSGENLSDWRLCVDEPDDFKLIEAVLAKFDFKEMSYKKLKEFLGNNSNLKLINKHIEQKKV